MIQKIILHLINFISVVTIAGAVVVLCIVLFSTPVETYVTYSLNRIFDTAVGVIVALLVNYFLPRERVVACWEKFKGFFRPVEHS